jgi:hypothetical protein
MQKNERKKQNQDGLSTIIDRRWGLLLATGCIIIGLMLAFIFF